MPEIPVVKLLEMITVSPNNVLAAFMHSVGVFYNSGGPFINAPSE